MRLGFDAIRALHNPTGLGNYARGVLRSLRERDPRIELHLYAARPPAAEFQGFPAEVGATLHLPTDAATPLARATWRTFRLGRAAAADRIQLYHGLTHEIPRDLPRTGVRSVVTFHDLIFERSPEYFGGFDRWSYRWRYRWSAAHADAIVAVSRQTRDDLVARYRIDGARIAVIPPARSTAFAVARPEAARAAARARYQLPDEYLLTVGTLEPRKNQGMLVAALAAAPAAPPLVLIGRDGGSAAAIAAAAARLGLGSRVLLRTNVATADLPALVQSATLFLYPSLVEGFGMPIVEALSAGIPVVAASGGGLVDAGGPGSRYLPPTDPGAWAAAIAELIGDSGARARMRRDGLDHARQFDGDRVAARLLAVYDAVMANTALP